MQPERNYNAGITFAPSKFISLGTTLTRGQVGNRGIASTTSSSSTESIVWAQNQSVDFRAQLNYPNRPTLTFAHRQTDQNSAGSKNGLVTTSLDSTWAVNQKLRLETGLSRTTSQGS